MQHSKALSECMLDCCGQTLSDTAVCAGSSSSYPFNLGQSMDRVLDGVGGDDVRVVSHQVILACFERELHVGFQLDDLVVAALSPDDQHLHHVLAVACPHKLHILHTQTWHVTDTFTVIAITTIQRLLKEIHCFPSVISSQLL